MEKAADEPKSDDSAKDSQRVTTVGKTVCAPKSDDSGKYSGSYRAYGMGQTYSESDTQ